MPGRNEQIDFYVLAGGGDSAARHFACRLVEKIYRQGLRVFVRLDSPPQVQEFDQLLWTFSQNSFVPHATQDTPEQDEAPVVIGQHPDAASAQVLINLGESIPDTPEDFSRIAEVVVQDDASRDLGRERFRQYRDRGFTLKTHEIAR